MGFSAGFVKPVSQGEGVRQGSGGGLGGWGSRAAGREEPDNKQEGNVAHKHILGCPVSLTLMNNRRPPYPL